MSWAAVLLAVLKGVGVFVDFLKTKQLINAGEAKAVNESLTEAIRRSERAAEIRNDVGDMPAHQLFDELQSITRDKGS